MASTISFGDANSGFQAGVHNGPTTAHFHPQPAAVRRRRSPPSSSSTVPFPRDREFVDRTLLLGQMHEKCSAPASRIALVGLSGVGKSQLAIEYSYRVPPNTWILWIHASNNSRFEQSCREIANHFKIPGRKGPRADNSSLVHDWLQDERNGNWILILDNLDYDYFHHAARPTSPDGPAGGQYRILPGHSLFSRLPSNPNGSILVTSTNRDAASKIVGWNDMIAIEPMEETHAIQLFQKKLGPGKQANREHMLELAAALDFMPLAIVQAATYIKKMWPRSSVSRHLEEFRRSDRRKIDLLQYEGKDLRQDREASHSIIITLQKQLDHIQQIRPSAADLLSRMSFFNRHEIPEYFLKDQAEAGSSNEDHCCDCRGCCGCCEVRASANSGGNATESDPEFEEDIRTLRDYFMISNVDETTFEMLRLVQLATRTWLEARGKLEEYEPQGRWKEAEELQWQESAVQKLVLASNHDISAIMKQQPSECSSQVRWVEAEELDIQAREATEWQQDNIPEPDYLPRFVNEMMGFLPFAMCFSFLFLLVSWCLGWWLNPYRPLSF